MTLAVTRTDPPLGAITVFRIVKSFLNLKEAVLVWNERRITRKELLNLSDDQLKDIGLNRSDLY